MVNQLPQGWKEEELGKLADVSSGDSAPQSSSCFLNGSYPFCRTSDVGKIHRSSNFSEIEDYINETAISKLHLFHRGTILFPKSGASTLLNHRVMLSIDSYVSSHLATIYANSIDRYYLYYFLCTVDAKQLVPNLDYPSLKISELKNIKVPYPTDKGEQDYIVKTLDAVAEIIRLRKETIQLAKELIPTIFQEMFGDPITNPKGWDKKDLGDICSKITDGSHNPPKGIKEGIFILLSSQNILNNGINTNGCRFVSEDDFIKENKRTKLSYGDILLTIVGTIGRSAIYKKQYENIIFQRSVAVLSPNKKFVNSEYLNAYIQTDFIQNVLQNKAHGVAQLGIYLKDLRKVEVLCPPLSKQEEFADKVEQINKYIAAQQEELEQFETLFQSLLQEAFTGVLTWNYPRKECHDKKDK